MIQESLITLRGILHWVAHGSIQLPVSVGHGACIFDGLVPTVHESACFWSVNWKMELMACLFLNKKSPMNEYRKYLHKMKNQ